MESRGKFFLKKKPRRDYELQKIEDMPNFQPNLSNKQITQISLSESCKAIILGSILGDGCLKLYKPYKNVRFWIRHSWPQKEYWEWKSRQLHEIQTPKSNIIQKPQGWSSNKKLLFQSAALEELTKIYNITYKNNRIQIKRTWLNHMTPLSLAIWWLDDGSIISHGKKGVLCTDNLSKKENQILQRYLYKVWNIEVKLVKLHRFYKTQSKEFFRLYLNTTSLKKLFRIIMNQVPVPSMIYKYCLLYKDTELQQRWISEMVTALPMFEEIIKDLILSRKKQFKYFRK